MIIIAIGIILIIIIFIIITYYYRSSIVSNKDTKDVNNSIEIWEQRYGDYLKAINRTLAKASIGATSIDKATLLLVHENPENYVLSENDELKALARLRVDTALLKTACLVSSDKSKERRLSNDSLVSGNSFISNIGYMSTSNPLQLSTPRSKHSSDNSLDTPVKLINDEFISDLLKVSAILCKRLNESNPVEGGFNETNDDNIQVGEPSWPSWLSDESFEVIKVSKSGSKKYTRLLRLTKYHILSIRKSQGVTNAYDYIDIASINVSSDHQIITITFKSDMQTFLYNTKLAPVVAQQIVTRLRVRTFLDSNVNFLYCTDVPKLGYVLESSTSLISSIGLDLSKLEKPEPLIEFAKNLNQKVYPKVDKGESINKNKYVRSRTVDSFNFLCKLLVASTDSQEYVLQSFIKKILYDVATPEGKERSTFLGTMVNNIYSERLINIRLWIEGMHSFIAASRKLELYKIYMFTSDHNNEQHDEIDFDLVSDDIMTIISFIIFSSVEESIYSVLNHDINKLLSTQSDIRQRILVDKINFLSTKTQKDWGLANKLQGEVSIHNWKNASFELSNMEQNETPLLRLYALQKSIHAIYIEFDKEVVRRLTRNGKKDCSLILDDLLAIFIFVLCQSNLKNPLLMRDLLWQLVYPNQLINDFGYYLTIFDLAIDVIEKIQINDSKLNSPVLPHDDDTDDDEFQDCD